MKPTRPLKQALAKVRRLWLGGRHGPALAEVERLLHEWPDNPNLLVLRADLIQLQEQREGPTLDDAKQAYERAVALDPESPEPLLELGHFLYALEDDARAATQYYDKAIDLCKHLLKEALVGQAKALAEFGRRSEALACVAEAYWLHARDGKASRNGRKDDELLEQLQELGQV